MEKEKLVSADQYQGISAEHTIGFHEQHFTYTSDVWDLLPGIMRRVDENIEKSIMSALNNQDDI